MSTGIYIHKCMGAGRQLQCMNLHRPVSAHVFVSQELVGQPDCSWYKDSAVFSHSKGGIWDSLGSTDRHKDSRPERIKGRKIDCECKIHK